MGANERLWRDAKVKVKVRIICENSVMKDKNEKNVTKSHALLALLAIAVLTTAVTRTAKAKSLYIIADIKPSSVDKKEPVQAYDIGVDGTLTFQAQYDIPYRGIGAVGMAIDSDSGYVFITYESSSVIQLLEATTMTDAGTTVAPDAGDLAGIRYDHGKHLLYCVDRATNNLYVYNWFPETAKLTHAQGSPFHLENAHAYGIALDEIDGLLYVANASNTVTVYRTSDWKLVKTITLSHLAISIALDVRNGFIYTGGGYAGNRYLTQYHLADNSEQNVRVEPDAGVMGLAVNPATGFVYLDTGVNDASGGDNLLVYDSDLNQIQFIAAIGNPTGLAVPGKDIGYNPLNLKKQVVRGATASTEAGDIKTVSPGDTYTYGIYFDNNNTYKVTDVSIVDVLPKEVTFVTADDDGVNGHYNFDEKTKKATYTWVYGELPPRSSSLLELTVQVKPDVETGKIITNSVTINSNETPPTTTSVDVLTASNALNLKKGILGAKEGQVTQVNTGDVITYTIDFDNKSNDFPVTNVTVVDELSGDVTFLTARDEGKKASGKYDEKTHTYTWTISSLAPGASVHLELDVSVNPKVPLGTKITNTVTVVSDQTPESSASVDAVTYYKPLNIVKKAVNESGGEIGWVDPNDRFTYKICFDNNSNDAEVTDVSIVDQLPHEVTFVEAHNGKIMGKYDQKAHTYTWTYGTLKPGVTECVELVVDVKPDTSLDTTIINSVTIDSNETLPVTFVHNLPVGEVLMKIDDEDMSVKPNVLRRNGTSPNIMVVMNPKVFKKSEIDQNDRPELYYQDQNSKTESFILIENGSQSLSGSEDSPKITVLFNRAKLMDALYGYGEFKLRVMGKLKSDRTYFGDVIIHVTRFAGD
jgi:fimbrial isopeptide formation D2 family protein/uncharacterized repeat protein (TIGR01451 family)